MLRILRSIKNIKMPFACGAVLMVFMIAIPVNIEKVLTKKYLQNRSGNQLPTVLTQMSNALPIAGKTLILRLFINKTEVKLL